MSDKTMKTIGKVIPYVLVSLAAVLIILAVFLFTKPVDSMDPSSKLPAQKETTAETTAPGASIEESEFAPVPAVDVAGVDQLVNRYYEAKINSDANALNSIVEADREYSVAELASESQYISKYDDFSTYVIPGITDNYFLVYVKYKMYFNGIATGAPALNHFIVAKDADGYYYIYDREVSGEFATYVQETENSKTVTRLKDEVEKELQEACASDVDLAYLLRVLNGEETLETPPVETESQETTAAENTDASEAPESESTEAPSETSAESSSEGSAE